MRTGILAINLRRMKILVHIPVKAIEALVNQRYGTLLYEGETNDPSGVITYISVTKRDRIRLYTDSTGLKTIGKVHVKARIRKSAPGIIDMIRDLYNLEKTQFDITVTLNTIIAVEKGWQLVTHTRGIFDWDKKPSAGPMNLLRITEIVRPHLEREIAALCKGIDEAIKTEVPLAEIVHTSWREICQVIPLPGDPEASLTLDIPDRVVKGNDLQFRSGNLILPLQVIPHFTVGRDLPPSVSLLPVPGFSPAQKSKSEFPHPFKAFLPFEFLCRKAGNQSFSLPNGTAVSIAEVIMERAEDDLIIVPKINGIIKLRRWSIPLEGRISLFINEGLSGPDGVSIPEIFRIEFQQTNWRIRLLMKFFKEKVLREINHQTKEFWKDIQEQVRQDIQKSVQIDNITPGIHLNGDLSHLLVNGWEVKETGVEVNGVWNFCLEVKIETIPEFLTT